MDRQGQKNNNMQAKMFTKTRVSVLACAALLLPGGQGLVPRHRPLHRASVQANAAAALASAVGSPAGSQAVAAPHASPTTRPSLAVDAAAEATEALLLPPWRHTLNPAERSVAPLL